MTKASWLAAGADRRLALGAAVIAGLLVPGLRASAAGPAPARTGAPFDARSSIDPASPPPQTEPDPVSRSVAARARTNECGHQWNNMKRAGTATGTTWKEFFRGCQAQR